MSQKFYVRNKETGQVIGCDWQNAFELVNHGFWEWNTGDGRKEFHAAQRMARNLPPPEGFDREVPLEDPKDEDDDAPVIVTPAAPVVTVETVAQTAVNPAAAAKATLEDMTREELFDLAGKVGLTIDKRTGTKNLVAAIKAAQEAE